MGLGHTLTIELFDEAEMLQLTGDDREFACELITLFATSAAETLARMQREVGAEGDPHALQRLAHNLKGSALAVAAGAITAAAATLEKAGVTDMPSALRSLSAAFQETVALWERGGWISRVTRQTSEKKPSPVVAGEGFDPENQEPGSDLLSHRQSRH